MGNKQSGDNGEHPDVKTVQQLRQLRDDMRKNGNDDWENESVKSYCEFNPQDLPSRRTSSSEPKDPNDQINGSSGKKKWWDQYLDDFEDTPGGEGGDEGENYDDNEKPKPNSQEWLLQQARQSRSEELEKKQQKLRLE